MMQIVLYISKCSKKKLSKKEGFSLLEMSIVLAIIGIVLHFSIPTLMTKIREQKRTATKERHIQIMRALGAYARDHKDQLPCPVPRGQERTGMGPKKCTTLSSCRGGLPVRTLGLPPEFTQDGAGNTIVYVMDGTGNLERLGTIKHDVLKEKKHMFPITVHTYKEDAPRDNIAVLLLSHGDFKEKSLNKSGHIFIEKPYSSRPEDPFDDIITWSTQRNLNVVYR